MDTVKPETQTAASSKPKADAEAQTKPKPKTARKAQKLGPHEIPYIRQGYTFADREQELSLLINLLDSRRRTCLEELDYVQNCIATSNYPGIVIGDE